MSLWRPTLSELVAPFAKVRPWSISLERYKKGIDNAHIDVYLSPRLCDEIRDTVHTLTLKEIGGQNGSHTRNLIGPQELESFRESYLEIFESISKQPGLGSLADRIALLQVSLLKYAIQVVSQEKSSLRAEFKTAVNEARASRRGVTMQDQLVSLARDEHAVNLSVLRFLFHQIKKIESGHLERVRESLTGEAWPFPKLAFFNPVLMVPDLDEVKELSRVYPIARLGDGGDTGWLFHTNQCISTVFQFFLPAWTRLPSYGSASQGVGGNNTQERRDQGQLRGFLGTEMLLSGFVPAEEYRAGRTSWLDDPDNLGLFLSSGLDGSGSYRGFGETAFGEPLDSELAYSHEPEPYNHASFSELTTADKAAPWPQEGWRDFQSAVAGELYRCLDLQGLGQRIVLLYWLRNIATQLGRPIPLTVASDFVEGRLNRRRLAQSLDAHQVALDPGAVARVLERTSTRLKNLSPNERTRYFDAYLTDFLILRRDLKLAYKTYEAMDRIRLLDDPRQVQLSRANASVYDFPGGGEKRPSSERPIHSHAVLKADVRGSTSITDGLRKRGLNPASHFSMNFFDPVNRLLPDFGAEKLFVEGDAVILSLFEHEGEPAPISVSRACGLARNMLQVVTLQNLINRKHGLPDLELGFGISYSSREPNFLYDEGHRIMISGAINRADRLSSCASELRKSGFRPSDNAYRVEVVRDMTGGIAAMVSESYLSYNVNGIKLEKAAFFKLQKELSLRQVRLPEPQMEDDLFFVGSFPDLADQEHWLVLRYAPVRQWNGRSLGPLDPANGHFFEVIVDESLSTRVRKLAASKEGLPLRGRR